jgi:hypothetical protein
MRASIKYLIALIFMVLTQSANAQDAEMADSFRAEGKIYVVVAIVVIVLAGLILYLFTLDRKISKLEHMITSKKQTKSAGKSF